MSTIIQCTNLSKRFGHHYANRQIHLKLEAGEIYGLVGRNGAGKTTLIKQFMGSLIPSEGELKLFDSTSLEKMRRRIGFSGDANFFAHLSGYENLRYYATLKGIKNRSVIGTLMEHWDLQPGDKKQYRRYSTGMKQKLALAAAMLGDPELLVLDEPINGLDPVSITHFRRTMLQLQKDRGTTIFVSSHILSELAMMCTRFGILENGRLIEELSGDELHAKARSTVFVRTSDPEKTAEFLARREVRSEREKDGFRLDPGAFEDGELSRCLAREAVYIIELRHDEHSLEDYYMSLIGDKHA